MANKKASASVECLVFCKAGPFLLAQIRFNLRMDEYSHGQYVQNEITYQSFNGCSVEVYEYMGHFIPRLDDIP